MIKPPLCPENRDHYIGILLLGSWWTSRNAVMPETRGGPQITRYPLPTDPPAPTVRRDGQIRYGAGATGLRKIELFRVIAEARQTALLEAQALVPPQEGGLLPTEPGLAMQKGDAKRARLADALFSKAQAKIARTHGLTHEEIGEIYERGTVEGWPPRPR